MKFSLRQELICLVLIALPFIYLAIVWPNLADTVPVHWNQYGEIDGWGPKYILIFIPFALPGLTYLIFSGIQRFGPKAKLEKMGRKFYSLKFILVLFMAVLALFVIRSSKEGAVGQPTFLFVSLGLLFTVLGNFFKTIQPNYFIGIRTPWTLRHESVWKSTHEMAGKMWFIGGLIIALVALISTGLTALITMFSVVGIIVVIPVVFSYLEAKKIQS